MATGIDLKARLEQRVSKQGKPYFAIFVKLTDNYEKTIFCDNSEIELIRLTYGSGSSSKVKLSSSSSSSES